MFAGILVFGYVELAFNICSLALSLCLAVGVNRVSSTPAAESVILSIGCCLILINCSI